MKTTTAVKASTGENIPSGSISPSEAFCFHLICGLGLAVAYWVAQNVYSINLISNPSHTLRLICVQSIVILDFIRFAVIVASFDVISYLSFSFLFGFQIIESPIVILLYSRFRQTPKQCSYWKAIGRGMLGIPAGALVNALGAIALGAPVGIQYLPKTVNWSLLMSVFTFVPSASVFGSSWTDWQRIFAHTKPVGSIDYMICLPAHGAVIGAWFGTWPMPLDWERQWQEWPICVSYGAIAGYLVGLVASFGFVLVRGGRQHVKED